VWLSALIALGGLLLLSLGRLSLAVPSLGDLLVLGCALGWSLHIVTLGHLGIRHNPYLISIGQLAVASCLQVMLCFPSGWDAGAPSHVWLLLLFSGALGCGAAYFLQVLGQRALRPTFAAAALAMEASFSSAISLYG
jgi:drug/metabolite transporter (DMT)-like permease